MNTEAVHSTPTAFMDPGSPAFAGAGKSGMTLYDGAALAFPLHLG